MQGMYLVASMGPPGGGRMVISRRLQSRFNLINMTFPQVSTPKSCLNMSFQSPLPGESNKKNIWNNDQPEVARL